MTNPADEEDASELAVQNCIRWLALVLDTELGPAEAVEDSASVEALALLRRPDCCSSVGDSESSLMLALADGRLLGRLLGRAGVAPADAGAIDSPRAFVAWCRRASLPEAPSDGPRASAGAVLRCLQALANWEGVSADMPILDLSWSPATCSRMLHLPIPDAATPVEAELTRIVNYYRLSLTLCDLLERSPLSYWPSDEVQAAFRHHRQLLTEYAKIRAELRRSGGDHDDDGSWETRLETALSGHSARLGVLHASQVSQWQLESSSAVRHLLLEEPRRARQVRLALKRLTDPADVWGQRDMEQLQLMPAFQVKSLSKSVAQMANRGCSEPLTRAKTLMRELDGRLTIHLERLDAQAKPSLAALKAINGGPKPGGLRFESLGQLRWEGHVTLLVMDGRQQPRRCYLWDGALVLTGVETGDYHRMLEMTPLTDFQPHEAAGLLGAGIRVQGTTPHQQQAQSLLPLVLACDTLEERRAWLEAARVARDARYPRGGNAASGHAFRQAYFGPECLSDGCYRCQRPLVGFCYVCEGDCGMRLDLVCIRTLQKACQKDSDYQHRSQSLKYGVRPAPNGPPVPKPRRPRGALSSEGGGSSEAEGLQQPQSATFTQSQRPPPPRPQRAGLARFQSVPADNSSGSGDTQHPVYDRLL